MARFCRAWTAFWFSPSVPARLGVARLLFVSLLFFHYAAVDFGGWARVSSAFWFPGALVAHLPLPIFSEAVLRVLTLVWKIALAMGAVGLATRASLATSFVLGFALLGMRSGFVEVIFHEDACAVFGLGILAFAHAGDAWSLDGVLRGARARSPSGEYTWPLRLMQCLLACIFFGAGVSKLRHAGLGWGSELFPTLQMVGHYHLVHNEPLVGWGTALYRHPALGGMVGATTLAAELGYPLALASRLARMLLVPAMALILVAIRVLMGPCFIVVLAAHVFWLPWRAGWE